MATSRHANSSRGRVKAHRDRLRRQGLRSLQIWVSDVRTPAFKAEASRQAQAVADSPYDLKDQDFIDSVSEWRA